MAASIIPEGDASRLVESDPQLSWKTIIVNGLAWCGLGMIMVIGHLTEWKLPLFQHPSKEPDLCAAHLVPEAECIECHPELYPKPPPVDYCWEHGVAVCLWHHPELAELSQPLPAPLAEPKSAFSMRPRFRNNPRNNLHEHRLQLASGDTLDKAGINVDVVRVQPMQEKLLVPAELALDPSSQAHVSSKVTGTVIHVYRKLGEQVRSGEPLLILDSVLVGQAKSTWLQAVVRRRLAEIHWNRIQHIRDDGVVSQRNVLEAESAYQQARLEESAARLALMNLGFDLSDVAMATDVLSDEGHLARWGIPDELWESLPMNQRTSNLWVLRAPMSGVLLNCDWVPGELVEAGKILATVVDVQKLWGWLFVKAEEAYLVKPRQQVMFCPDGIQAEVKGHVTWISPEAEEHTRAVKVRFELDEVPAWAKDRTFGKGWLILRDEPHALVIPRSALQRMRDAHVVFVRNKDFFKPGAPRFFSPRQIVVGAETEDTLEVLAGLYPGEVIATRGSQILLSHLLRNNLGAGCGCHP